MRLVKKGDKMALTESIVEMVTVRPVDRALIKDIEVDVTCHHGPAKVVARGFNKQVMFSGTVEELGEAVNGGGEFCWVVDSRVRGN